MANPIDNVMDRLMGLHPRLIDLSLDRLMVLLGKLGSPEQHLPPEIPAQLIAWLCRAEAADYPQGECAIRDEALLQRAGITLPA